MLGAVSSVPANETQPATPMMMQQYASTITVVGAGYVSVTPDTGSVTLGVTIVQPTLADAQSESTRLMTAIIGQLKTDGVAAADIQTSNYSVSVNQSYDASGIPGEITGYSVSNHVSVTVRDLANLGSVLDGAVGQGANSIWGVSFYVADPAEASKEARELAVADAIERANQIASAAGLRVGAIVSISEPSSPYTVDSYARGGGQAAGVPIEVGTTTISASVTITFALEQ